MTWLLVAVLCILSVSCATRNPNHDPAKPHHTASGFRNNYHETEKGFADFMRWQWQRWRTGLPADPEPPLNGVEPDLEFIQRNRKEISITWIGHATVLLQVAGLNVITDPHFSERASPFSLIGPRRLQPPGIALEDLPHIHAVVISHSHYDHLDRRSVRALYRQDGGPPMFFLPLGLGDWFKKHVTDGPTEHLQIMDWWDTRQYRGLTFRLLPVQHWSARSIWDRNRTLWGAWSVAHTEFSFFFSGDLGYSQDLQDIGRALGQVDFAAIAIGAYEPRWFMRDHHINPTEAVRAHQDINARQSLGIHWGTFTRLTDEPLDQPPKDLAAARSAAGLSEHEFFVLRHGETYRPTATTAKTEHGANRRIVSAR